MKKRLDKEKNALDYFQPDFKNVQESAKLLKEAIDNGEMCQIKGRLKLQKVIARQYDIALGDRSNSVFNGH